METKRPEGYPDVQGANIRFKVDGEEVRIEYDLYFERETTRDWIIPTDTTFDPPDWLEEGMDIVAWSINRGTKRQPDYDWVWVEPASKYYKADSALSRRIKVNGMKKKIKELEANLDDLKNNFNDLFE